MARVPKDQTTDKPAKRPHSSTPKNTDVDKLLRQREKNPLLTITDQAKLNNISKQALQQLYKRHGVDIDAIGLFKEQRADILAAKQDMVLSALTEEDVKKASARDKAIVFGTLYDKERLERGQSTNNTSVFFHVVAEAPDLPGQNTTSSGVVTVELQDNEKSSS